MELFYTYCKGKFLHFRLCGFPPFYEENNKILFEKIKNAEYEFPSPYWDHVSDTAKDIIRALLVIDPAKRLNADQILSHPWVVGTDTSRKELPGVTQQMKEYNAKRKFKVIINFIIIYREQVTWLWLPTGSRIFSPKTEL